MTPNDVTANDVSTNIESLAQ